MALNPQVEAYAAQLNTYADRLHTGIDGVSGDIAGVKADLEFIQNSPGTLSVEDQAHLDSALTKIASAADKVEALDAATPPKPQVPPQV